MKKSVLIVALVAMTVCTGCHRNRNEYPERYNAEEEYVEEAVEAEYEEVDTCFVVEEEYAVDSTAVAW